MREFIRKFATVLLWILALAFLVFTLWARWKLWPPDLG